MDADGVSTGKVASFFQIRTDENACATPYSCAKGDPRKWSEDVRPCLGFVVRAGGVFLGRFKGLEHSQHF
jgi:hypothetical protein